MMVLGHSTPMGNGPGSPLSVMQADAIAFVNMFVNGTDNIGLVTYTAAPFVADPLPNANFQLNVPNDVNLMQAPNTSGSSTAAAISAAYGQLNNPNPGVFRQPGALNVIVLFTDGLTNAFAGNFAPYLTSTTPCNPSPGSALNGVIFTTPSPLFNFLYALSDPTSLSSTANSVTDNPDVHPAPGCTGLNVPSAFLSGMPATDIYGNSTNGYEPVNLNSPIVGTSGYWNIVWASENALDNAANQIRGNAALPATIFVIGLGDLPATYPPDPVLMPRIANDPSSASYNSSQPAGQYILAPTAAQLQSAFAGIASQVLKLATQ
jgi:hypothetical protein